MLIQLNIQNIALIDNISIEFGSGLNVLTGETGAGKSIIIDSINAILGMRGSKELIRSGKDKAYVEAAFFIDNGRFCDLFQETGIEPEEDGSLIISRELSTEGRNTCRINGKMVTVSMLRNFGSRLIDVHGQHDNQSLLRVNNHIDLLDAFGGNETLELKQKYIAHFVKYKQLQQKLKEMTGDIGERERKIDLLRYQIDEIEKANPKINEDEELKKQRELMANSEKISLSLLSAYETLFTGNNMESSTEDGLNKALIRLQSIAQLDSSFSEIENKLQSLIYQLEDIKDDIRSAQEQIEYNPESQEEVEERLDVLNKLKRKYAATAGSISEVLEYKEKAEKQLNEIIQSEKIVAGLNKNIEQELKKLHDSAEKLSDKRKKVAEKLEQTITTHLRELEMSKALFKVDFSSSDRQPTHNGIDRVEFLISVNAGEPLKPLAKVASGGEMSRIMLAIKTVLADADSMPTLIFDEIDTGVSGVAAQKVGEKLSLISFNHQVICVTHLPQIACMADRHFVIEKSMDQRSTFTSVSQMQGDDIIKELARMLGTPSGSKTSIIYARELLENAKEIKNNL
jgi:DNA repair protein RecN (Recombination protein N)